MSHSSRNVRDRVAAWGFWGLCSGFLVVAALLSRSALISVGMPRLLPIGVGEAVVMWTPPVMAVLLVLSRRWWAQIVGVLCLAGFADYARRLVVDRTASGNIFFFLGTALIVAVASAAVIGVELWARRDGVVPDRIRRHRGFVSLVMLGVLAAMGLLAYYFEVVLSA